MTYNPEALAREMAHRVYGILEHVLFDKGWFPHIDPDTNEEEDDLYTDPVTGQKENLWTAHFIQFVRDRINVHDPYLPPY